jgi:hypothetical protein
MNVMHSTRVVLVLIVLTIVALANFAKASDVGINSSLDIEIQRKSEVTVPDITETDFKGAGEAREAEKSTRWGPKVVVTHRRYPAMLYE